LGSRQAHTGGPIMTVSTYVTWSARAAGRWLEGDGGRSQNCAPYMGSERGWLASDWPSTGAFSTLLRRPGLRASSDSVLATKSERKMLASTCLYSLCAWLIFGLDWRTRRASTSRSQASSSDEFYNSPDLCQSVVCHKCKSASVLKFADESLIFAVLQRWLLQQEKLHQVLIHNFAVLLGKTGSAAWCRSSKHCWDMAIWRFNGFQKGGRPPFWICCLCVWITLAARYHYIKFSWNRCTILIICNFE